MGDGGWYIDDEGEVAPAETRYPEEEVCGTASLPGPVVAGGSAGLDR